MTNHNFPTLSLDNLDTVTGGSHDADPTSPPAPLQPSGGAAVGAALTPAIIDALRRSTTTTV